tara:strand:- start:175 stop:450 length:276 start_codon:yes stop_codon:yes gene_type:complete
VAAPQGLLKKPCLPQLTLLALSLQLLQIKPLPSASKYFHLRQLSQNKVKIPEHPTHLTLYSAILYLTLSLINQFYPRIYIYRIKVQIFPDV